MSNETTPQDSAAMSPASAGSAAWPRVGVISENRLRELMANVGLLYSKSLLAALRQCDMEARLDVVARLRLTDAERQAIKEAADAYEQNNGDPDCERIADTLHGLLDRLGPALTPTPPSTAAAEGVEK